MHDHTNEIKTLILIESVKVKPVSFATMYSICIPSLSHIHVKCSIPKSVECELQNFNFESCLLSKLNFYIYCIYNICIYKRSVLSRGQVQSKYKKGLCTAHTDSKV